MNTDVFTSVRIAVGGSRGLPAARFISLALRVLHGLVFLSRYWLQNAQKGGGRYLSSISLKINNLANIRGLFPPVEAIFMPTEKWGRYLEYSCALGLQWVTKVRSGTW